MKKYYQNLIPVAAIVLLASCGGKGGSIAPESDLENYPVAEISKGLADAAPTYSEVYEFHDGLAKVKGGSDYGMIDKDGNLVIPCKYGMIEPHGKVFLVNLSYDLKESYGVIDQKGKVLVPLKYEEKEIGIFPEDGIIRYKDDDNQKYYFLDFNGKKLFAKGLEYIGNGTIDGDNVSTFSEGLAPAVLSHNSWSWIGFVDKTGKTVIKPKYNQASMFMNGLSRVLEDVSVEEFQSKFIDKTGNTVMKTTRNGELVGLTDASGKEIIPCKFEGIGTYNYGYVLTTGTNNRYGVWNLIDKKEIIPPTYDGIVALYDERLGERIFLHDSIIIVKNNDQYGAINIEGKEIAPCEYYYAEVKNGLLVADKKTGIISRISGVFDKEGNVILPCEYEIDEITNNCILAHKNVDGDGDISYLFDHKGNQILKQNGYQKIRPFSEGMAARSRDGIQYGFYDINGDKIIEPLYEDAKSFSEGLAPVKLNGKWGYVNRKGVDTFGNGKGKTEEK